ncbi:uncharacterized protein LOC126278395 [Schistocerca gregaria]|uniref:uncharacterized protein LOC126278395 n=1 Tax=Schistocerca gregaria TaxID=7010 RepID=UPI00211DA4E4|nr:uncharacterized protein LOC126278395 [Schistocerca gregaria]
MSDQGSVNDTEIEADVDEVASDSACVHDESVDEMHIAGNSTWALLPMVQEEEVAVEIWPPSVTEHSGLEQLPSPCDTSSTSHDSDTYDSDCASIDINENNICLFHFNDFCIGNYNRNNGVLSVFHICNYSFFNYNIHNRNFRFVVYNGSNSIPSLLSIVRDIVFNIFYMSTDTYNCDYTNTDINENFVWLLRFHDFYILRYNRNNETLSVLDIGKYSIFSYNFRNRNFHFMRYNGSLLSILRDIVFNIFYMCRDTGNHDYTNTETNGNNI